MKKILITGSNSYIGESVRDYLSKEPNDYYVDIIDTMGLIPTPEIFQGYDVVFDVAGIAHVKETKKNRKLFFEVNCNLAVKIAKAAKKAGVKQFILLSSMSVYGAASGYIDKKTLPNPENAYGKSKLKADNIIKKLENDDFIFTCLRPPMVYGKGCKGNYQRLRNFALKAPFFPLLNNTRSMIYIGNLCEFVKICIDEKKSGLFFPQNSEYVSTSDMVNKIADCHGKTIKLIPCFNRIIKSFPVGIIKKVFGNLTYEKSDTVSKYDFYESIELSETKQDNMFRDSKKKKVLCIASMASNLDNFNQNNVKLLKELDCDITLAANFSSSEDTNSTEKIISFVEEMKSEGIAVIQIDFLRKISNIKAQWKSYKQVKKLLMSGFDVVHCHSPICAAITRIALFFDGLYGKTKVIYTAHGFHFFSGSPFINWILFYPLEKILSKLTDVLITINTEDYNRAKNHFAAKNIIYIPGIGIDTQKFNDFVPKDNIREELNIPLKDKVLLSVGELNDNKNHRLIIEALSKMKDKPYYIIVGKGELNDKLKQSICDYKLQDKIKLVGFRSDVASFYKEADFFVFPSHREGLSVACSKIRGNVDLIDEGKGGVYFDPNSVNSAIKSIQLLMNNSHGYGAYNMKKIRLFDITVVNKKMKDIYNYVLR